MSDDSINPFDSEELSEPLDEQWAAKRRLANELRRMLENLVTTSASAKHLNTIADQVAHGADVIGTAPQIKGRYAYVDSDPGGRMTIAAVGYELNPLSGLSNPIAAPLNSWLDEEAQTINGSVTMGWQYEGPPGCVHGGFVAALFDEFLGVGQRLTEQPGVTGTLTVKYRRPTPLDTELRLVGRVAKVEGRKNILVGEMWAGDTLTATCEGLFIHIPTEAFLQLQKDK